MYIPYQIVTFQQLFDAYEKQVVVDKCTIKVERLAR